MEIREFAPIGYSDLTEDEAFLITVYRHWQNSGPSRKVAEQSLVALLRNDRLYDGLQPLFELFRTFPEQGEHTRRRDSAVLSSAEESLLDEIGSAGHGRKPRVEIIRNVLESANVTVRPVSEIPRSGHDRLVEQIDRKAAIVRQILYPNT